MDLMELPRTTTTQYRPIRVLLCNKHPWVRAGMRATLQSYEDIEVADELADGRDVVARARRLLVDVVLVEMSLPLVDGLTVTSRLAGPTIRPKLPVILLADEGEEALLLDAIKAGARGFVTTPNSTDLVRAVRLVASGQAFLSPASARDLLDWLATRLPEASPPVQRSVSDLSQREREVLELLGEGSSNAEIAKLLVISETTVRSHVHHILIKLNLRRRTQAVLVGYQYRLGNGYGQPAAPLDPHQNRGGSS